MWSTAVLSPRQVWGPQPARRGFISHGGRSRAHPAQVAWTNHVKTGTNRRNLGCMCSAGPDERVSRASGGQGLTSWHRGAATRPFGIIAFDFPERAGGILLPTTIARIEKAARKAWRLPIKVPLPTAPVRYRRSAKTTITMSTMSTSVPMPMYTGASLPLNC